MSDMLIILALGSLLGMLNRSQARAGDGEQDEIWAAFEAAMRSEGPSDEAVRARRKDEGEDEDDDEESYEGQVRTSVTMGDTTVKLMPVGTVGFIHADDALVDDFGHLWLVETATVYALRDQGSLAVSRQPEGWFLQRYARPGGRWDYNQETVRVVGLFDFK